MRLIVTLLCLAALGGCDRQKADEQQGAPAASQGGPVAGLDRSRKGAQLPDFELVGPGGEPAELTDFRGKPLLLNLWATWCAPCVKELPTLNALGHAEGGWLQVAAISQDMAPQASVAAFLERLGTDALEPLQDPKMALSGQLGVEVLPTTILFDREGREVWRYVGDRDWNAADVRPLLAEGR